MPTRVRFRFNKATGEIEEFLVDDQDRTLPEAEHDRIAQEVARMVAVDARIWPVADGQERTEPPPHVARNEPARDVESPHEADVDSDPELTTS